MNKETIKKITPIGIVSFLLAICLLFIGYEFGWLKIKNGIYQQGFQEGKKQGSQELFNWEAQQVLMTGGFKMIIPTQNGTTEINLIWQK